MLKPDHLPFNALRAFEAAARSGSFVNAGAALGVSAAAVSQQVKALEGMLGKQLFLRQGNRITLTDAGRSLYPSVESAMTELSMATRRLRAAPRRARIVLSSLSSVADLWLIPALTGFAQGAQLDLRVEADPIDMARDGVDVRITYGAQYYPDHVVEPLFQNRLVAVAAPDSAFGARLGELHVTDLIHTDWGRDYGVQPDWAHHFETVGDGRRVDAGQGLRVQSTSMAVAAACAGLGVALAPELLILGHERAGQVRRIGPVANPLPRDYVMITPNARARNRDVQSLRRHLLGVVGAD